MWLRDGDEGDGEAVCVTLFMKCPENQCAKLWKM